MFGISATDMNAFKHIAAFALTLSVIGCGFSESEPPITVKTAEVEPAALKAEGFPMLYPENGDRIAEFRHASYCESASPACFKPFLFDYESAPGWRIILMGPIDYLVGQKYVDGLSMLRDTNKEIANFHIEVWNSKPFDPLGWQYEDEATLNATWLVILPRH